MYDYHMPPHIEKKKIVITDENDMTISFKTPITIKAFKGDNLLSLTPYSAYQQFVEISIDGNYVYLPYIGIYNPGSFIHIKIRGKENVDRVELEYFDPDQIYINSFVLDRDSIIDFHFLMTDTHYDSDWNLESEKSIPVNMKNDHIKIFINDEPWTDSCGLSCEFEKGTRIRYEVYNTFDASMKQGLICRTCNVIIIIR